MLNLRPYHYNIPYHWYHAGYNRVPEDGLDEIGERHEEHIKELKAQYHNELKNIIVSGQKETIITETEWDLYSRRTIMKMEW